MGVFIETRRNIGTDGRFKAGSTLQGSGVHLQRCSDTVLVWVELNPGAPGPELHPEVALVSGDVGAGRHCYGDWRTLVTQKFGSRG